MTCVALIVAAGRGIRAGGGMPKQYRALAGRPVLAHTIARFARHGRVDQTRVVIHPDDRALYDQAAAGFDLLAPVAGGATRQDSVRLGLESLTGATRVLIHDAARPFIAAATIDAVIDALDRHPGAIPAVPVADTLKRDAGGLSAGTVPRAGLMRAQTPQGFRFADILAAHRRAIGQDLTDDAAVAEAAGMSVALVPGSEENFKLTTDDDPRIVPHSPTAGPGESYKSPPSDR